MLRKLPLAILGAYCGQPRSRCPSSHCRKPAVGDLGSATAFSPRRRGFQTKPEIVNLRNPIGWTPFCGTTQRVALQVLLALRRVGNAARFWQLCAVLDTECPYRRVQLLFGPQAANARTTAIQRSGQLGPSRPSRKTPGNFLKNVSTKISAGDNLSGDQAHSGGGKPKAVLSVRARDTGSPCAVIRLSASRWPLGLPRQMAAG